MIGRLVRSVDFERVLRTRSRVSSAHFAVHHVADRPSKPAKVLKASARDASAAELSTGGAPIPHSPVDDSGGNVPRLVQKLPSGPLPEPSSAFAPDQVWLGTVVPKRHARRSVTRTLLKRQIRNAVAGQQSTLASGLWVVRLRAPFDRLKFPSAASGAMKLQARIELDKLLADAVARFGVR